MNLTFIAQKIIKYKILSIEETVEFQSTVSSMPSA